MGVYVQNGGVVKAEPLPQEFSCFLPRKEDRTDHWATTAAFLLNRTILNLPLQDQYIIGITAGSQPSACSVIRMDDCYFTVGTSGSAELVMPIMAIEVDELLAFLNANGRPPRYEDLTKMEVNKDNE